MTRIDFERETEKAFTIFIAFSPFYFHASQLKKREKIPDIECLEQMEMIKNEIDLFLEHHQALCQQTSPSLLDYLRYIKHPPKAKLATN